MRAARARRSSAASSKARIRMAGRIASQQGISAFSAARALKKSGTRPIRIFRVTSS